MLNELNTFNLLLQYVTKLLMILLEMFFQENLRYKPFQEHTTSAASKCIPGKRGRRRRKKRKQLLARKNSKPEKIQMDGAIEAKRTRRQIEEGMDQRRY